MNRRTFLTTTALATAGLAGCSASTVDSGDSKVGGQPTKTVSQRSAQKRLAFGETLDIGRAALTLSAPSVTSSYSYQDGGDQKRMAAGEGKQWVVVPMRAENTADRTVRLPMTANFGGIVGNNLFHPGRNKSVDQKYIGGKVGSGEAREGDMMFLTPVGVSVDEFRVFYREKRSSGKHEVWWQSGADE